MLDGLKVETITVLLTELPNYQQEYVERTLIVAHFFFTIDFREKRKKKKKLLRDELYVMLCHVFWYDVFFFLSPLPSPPDLIDDTVCDSTGKKKIAHSCYNCCWLRPPTKRPAPLLYSSGLSQSITQTLLRSVVPCRNSYHPVRVTSYQPHARALLLFPLPPGSKCQRAYATNVKNS